MKLKKLDGLAVSKSSHPLDYQEAMEMCVDKFSDYERLKENFSNDTSNDYLRLKIADIENGFSIKRAVRKSYNLFDIYNLEYAISLRQEMNIFRDLKAFARTYLHRIYKEFDISLTKLQREDTVFFGANNKSIKVTTTFYPKYLFPLVDEIITCVLANMENEIEIGHEKSVIHYKLRYEIPFDNNFLDWEDINLEFVDYLFRFFEEKRFAEIKKEYPLAFSAKYCVFSIKEMSQMLLDFTNLYPKEVYSMVKKFIKEIGKTEEDEEFEETKQYNSTSIDKLSQIEIYEIMGNSWFTILQKYFNVWIAIGKERERNCDQTSYRNYFLNQKRNNMFSLKRYRDIPVKKRNFPVPFIEVIDYLGYCTKNQEKIDQIIKLFQESTFYDERLFLTYKSEKLFNKRKEDKKDLIYTERANLFYLKNLCDKFKLDDKKLKGEIKKTKLYLSSRIKRILEGESTTI